VDRDDGGKPHEVHRAEVLMRTEAKTRFLSIEPMLDDPLIPDGWFNSFSQVIIGCEKVGGRTKRLPNEGIDGFWAVAKHIRKQCEHAGTAFFLKQWPDENGRVESDLAKCPRPDMALRQFPNE